MPKKKKKKKKKGKGADAQAKFDELKEMKTSRERLAGQLDIKSTQFMNLQHEYQRAQDLIQSLERRLRRETDSLKQELLLKIEEHATIQQHYQFESSSQNEKLKLFEAQLAASGVVVEENEMLRKRVTNLNGILSSQSTDHATTIHSMNSDRFNIRLQLEQAFRKALVEAKEKSQEDALQAMSDESKRAIQLNRELKGELQSQARGIRKMCEHFDLRDNQLKASKLQNRLHESQINSMTSELTRLARTIQRQKREMEEKDQDLEDAKKAVEAAENKVNEMNDVLSRKQETMEEKDTYIKTMQARIHFLSQKLNKAMSRRASGSTLSNKLRTARQKQLLMESAKSSTPSTLQGSRKLSKSFKHSATISSFDHPEEAQQEDANGFDDHHSQILKLDPTMIWNNKSRNGSTQSYSVPQSPSVFEITYPNRDPLRLDGTRSNRTTNVSSQFVP